MIEHRPTDGGTLLGGRYRLGRVMGRGAMGVVYAAHDVVLDRPVAAKLLHLHLTDDPETRDRFAQEARLAAQLQHPHAVSMFDHGEHEGVPYLIMELIEGETLADRMSRGPLAPAAVRSIGDQLLDALGAAHRLGIVHRDVKPANILLSVEGGAKLVDFGIAKALQSSTRTAIGLVVGTPAYLAPERLHGESATPRADLYSLGAVLYEALTQAKVAIDSPRSAPQIAAKVAQDLRVRRPDVDDALAAAIAGALVSDPSDRFPDAEAMQVALSPARVAGEPRPLATMVMPLRKLRPASRNHAVTPNATHPRRVPVLAWVAVAVLAIAGALGVSAFRGRAGPPAAPQQVVELTPAGPSVSAAQTPPRAGSDVSSAPSSQGAADPTTTTHSTTTTAPSAASIDSPSGKGKGKGKH
jgi:serine/threonine protein kinase